MKQRKIAKAQKRRRRNRENAPRKIFWTKVIDLLDEDSLDLLLKKSREMKSEGKKNVKGPKDKEKK